MHTIKAPYQKEIVSGVLSKIAEKKAENTGMKYEAPANNVTLPCKIPTFHAA